MNPITIGSTVVASLAVICTSTIGAYNFFTPRDDFDVHVSSSRVQTILQLAKDGQDEHSDWLCNALHAEFIALCTEQPEHYLCTDPNAKKELMAKAKCEGTG